MSKAVSSNGNRNIKTVDLRFLAVLCGEFETLQLFAKANCNKTTTCGVASVSRIDKIIGLFCKRAL